MNSQSKVAAFLLASVLAWTILAIGQVASSMPQVVLGNIRVSNVRDTSLAISWTSDVTGTGEVQFGTNRGALASHADDDRGASTQDDVHYVTVRSLTPQTTYYFDVITSGSVNNNATRHFSATTGSTLSLPSSDTVYGRVLLAGDSTPAVGSLVHLTVVDFNGSDSTGSSSVLSSLVDASGYWHANLGSARSADLAGYFGYSASGDHVLLEVNGAVFGQTNRTDDTANDSPAADVTIGGPPTATPTTGTQSPTPTPTRTSTPTPTATLPPAQDNGLVALWRLNEGSGTTAADSSPSLITGTITGATWTTGKAGQALNFGASQYVNVPNNSLLQLAGDISLAAWVYPTQFAVWEAVFGRDRDYSIWANNGTIEWFSNDLSPNEVRGPVLGLNAWSFVVATYNMSGHEVRLYVNGELVRTQAMTGNISYVSVPLTIGNDNPHTYSWLGKVDEVRVYNRILSAAEIVSLNDNPGGVVVATPTATPLTPAGILLKAGLGHALPGHDTTISVSIQDAPAGLGAAALNLSYDPAIVEPISCVMDPGAAFTSRHCNLFYDSNGDGKADSVSLSALSATGVQGNLALADIAFLVIGPKGRRSPLHITTRTLANTQGVSLTSTATDGMILADALGDVNCSSELDAVDGLFILQYDVNLVTSTTQCPPPLGKMNAALCDVTGDTVCNASDALMVMQCTNGLPNSLCPPSQLFSRRDSPIATGAKGAPAEAQRQAADGTVTVGSATAAVAGSVRVPVKAHVSTGRLGAATIEIRYDSRILSVYGCKMDVANVFDAEACNPKYDSNGDGQPDAVRFNVVSTAGVSGDLALAELDVRALNASVTSSPLNLVIDGAVDPSRSPLALTAENGRITISGQPAGSGPPSKVTVKSRLYVPSLRKAR